jgi:photosystem II stability/assembly factor-like uncharacterized protein
MEKDRKSKLAEKFTTLLFYTSLLIFFVAFNFRDNPGGWQLQNITNFKGQSISDVIFLDSLTGIFVTNDNIAYDTGYIFKTTNGGNNWTIKLVHPGGFNRISFIDSLVGYACGGTNTGTSQFYKTTNRGENWSLTNAPSTNFWNDMYILNKDTMWLVDRDGLLGGVFRSTNGGLNWIQQFYQFNQNPDKIYMVNKNLGFIGRDYNGYFGRTTDGGFNWTYTYGDTSFYDIHFIDSMTGWKASGANIKKTTNGGITWTWQTLPHLNFANVIFKFSFINKDTIFGVGGAYHFPSAYRGFVYKTTNGGINWGYQIPDTGFGISSSFWFINFADKVKGWAFPPSISKNIYTITGGSDTTFYTAINNQNNIIAKDYKLYQNYPNPFNATSNIKYKIEKTANIILIVFDITGKEIKILISKKQSSGNYEIKFDGGNLSSGIYFYTLFADGVRIDTKKAILIK